MQKAAAFFFVAFMVGLNLPLFAQEDEEVPADEWEGVMPSLYSTGERNFVFSLGVTVPMLFSGKSDPVPAMPSLKVGGTGFLAYNYFLTPHLFIGGEFGGMFAGTLGENMLYIVPFGVRVGWRFVIHKFEFPVSVMIGGAPQTYLETNYFGFFIKPQASALYRFNPDWSFGLNAAWWIVPEWGTTDSAKDMAAHFLELTLSAQYHF
jgi:hypothetical protein